MTFPAVAPGKPRTGQMTVAAEGIAAAQFARCGFDVSVQYGVEKPKYDLVVARGGKLLKVTVKGSQDGVWNLIQPYAERGTDRAVSRTDYQRGIESWLDNHGSRTVCCLVQFAGAALDELPRIYLATPREIAQRLRHTEPVQGGLMLYEAVEAGDARDTGASRETIPVSWRFSPQRIEEMIASHEMAPLRRLPGAILDTPATIWPFPEKMAGERQPALAVRAG